MKTLIFILVVFAGIIQAYGQSLSISFAKDSPKRVEKEYTTDLYFDLYISGVESMAELVVEKVSGEENSEPVVLHKLPLLKDSNGYYLEGGQRVYDELIRYYTGFPKHEIEKGSILFYAVDKTGARSNILSYALNP
jgi:hypothetical protein